MIDYAWVTPETMESFRAVLDKYALSFLQWRAKSRRKEQPLPKTYALWWSTKGPLGFRTNTDALRFKAELFSHVETQMDRLDLNA